MRLFWREPAGRSGGQVGVRIAKSAADAFEGFKAYPDGINAYGQLRTLFRGIENIQSSGERLAAARHFAFEIVSIVNSAPEAQRQAITRAIGNELMNSPLMEGVFAWVLGEMNDGKARGQMRAETQSQEERRRVGEFKSIVRDSLNRAGLSDFGNFSIETNGDDVVRFRRKPSGGGDGGGVPPHLRPGWYGGMKRAAKGVAAAVAFGALLYVTGRIITPLPQVGAREGGSAQATQEKKEYENPSQEMITPDDPWVLEAVRRATPKGPLTLDQVSGAYEFVINHVEYRFVSHQVVPRFPNQTLAPILQNCKEKNFRKCKSIADCKTMAVLLASMLESIGAKTVLIDWYDEKKDEGHEYVGVLVSEQQDDKKREAEVRRVRNRIIGRYYWKIRSLMGGRIPKIHIIDLVTKGKTEAYLLLDPTGGPDSIPGMADRKIDLEKYFESRPGVEGTVPK